jgi:hypothetical protein
MCSRRSHVLIVDRSRSWGVSLYAQLQESRVPSKLVASSEAALAFAKRAKVSVIVVSDDGTTLSPGLCKELKGTGAIPIYHRAL